MRLTLLSQESEGDVDKLHMDKDANDPNKPEDGKPQPIPVHHSEDDEGDPGRSEKKACQGEQKIPWPTRLSLISVAITATCTFAIVIITTFYTHYAGQQVGNMQDAVRIAAAQAVYMDDAADQARLEQRAWIGIVGGIGHVCEPGKPMALEVRFRNMGKTPGLSVTNSTSFKTGDIGTVPDFTFGGLGDPEVGGSVICPQQGFAFVDKDISKILWKQDNGDISKKMGKQNRNAIIDDILTQKKRLWVYGIINYDDVFGKQHWYKYCLFYDPETGGFLPHTEYNDIDSDTGNN